MLTNAIFIYPQFRTADIRMRFVQSDPKQLLQLYVVYVIKNNRKSFYCNQYEDPTSKQLGEYIDFRATAVPELMSHRSDSTRTLTALLVQSKAVSPL